MIQKLILGAGKTQREPNAVHHDMYDFEGIDVTHDLNVLPWPWEDNSFDSIVCNHVLEHLDSFLNFHNECWRILKPGGSLYLETPCAGMDADLEFCDPTHVRCYRPHSWTNYVTIEGIEKFEYTDKAWCSLHIEVRNANLFVHAMPLKYPNL